MLSKNADYRVAQVKVIFSIPLHVEKKLFPDNQKPPKYLAYVEWFTPFNNSSQIATHLLHRVKRVVHNGERLASIIPLTKIHRSIHLFPSFGPVAPREWTSSNVLDLCPQFYVNTFTDRHAYHIIT
jgi:hypothetical protein